MLSVLRISVTHDRMKKGIIMADQEPANGEYRVSYQLEWRRENGGFEEWEEIGFGSTLGCDSIAEATAEAVTSMTENGIYLAPKIGSAWPGR